MSSVRVTSKNLGFTLVELLIVIAIIGILVLIVVLVINPVERLRHARNVVRVNDLANIVRVLEVYNVENGTYPTEHYYDTSRGCTTTNPGGNWWEDPRFNSNDWSGGDCPAGETLDAQVSPDLLPKDPINKDYYVYQYNAVREPTGPLDRPYIGYATDVYLEGGKGVYRICGGDWKGSWIENTWPFCGINNPDP